ncbi:MAG: hypothetical protein AAGI53_17570 [Planctomycetota bacterium]
MNFSTDRDLLALAPDVFNELPFATQQRLRVEDADLDRTTLTSPTADFAAAGVGTGSVVLVNATPYEVIARIDAVTITVSRLRARLDGPAIPGEDGENLTAIARTLEPQATLVSAMLLRTLGIDADDPDAELTEDSVLSLSLMARLEALGTLEMAYASAATVAGDNAELRTKAEHFRRRFKQERESASVLIDRNGDGLPDERRHLGTLRMDRV